MDEDKIMDEQPETTEAAKRIRSGLYPPGDQSHSEMQLAITALEFTLGLLKRHYCYSGPYYTTHNEQAGIAGEQVDLTEDPDRFSDQ